MTRFTLRYLGQRTRLRILTCVVALLLIAISSSFISGLLAKAENETIPRVLCEYQRTPFGLAKGPCAKTRLGEADALDFLVSAKFARHRTQAGVASLHLVSGEKSVIADRGRFMSMSLAEDVNGNLVPDGTEVHFFSSGDAPSKSETLGGVAYQTFHAPRGAGYLEVVSSAGPVSTIADRIRVVPQEPVKVSMPPALRQSQLSDDRQILLETAHLEDQFGNRLVDGSFVQFSGSDAQGRRVFINTKSVNGIATAKYLQRRIGPGIWFNARHKDVIGTAVELKQSPAEIVAETRLAITKSTGGLTIDLGPLRYKSGAFVSDGFPALLRLPDGSTLQALSRDGIVRFVVSGEEEIKQAPLFLEAGARVWQFQPSGNSS